MTHEEDIFKKTNLKKTTDKTVTASVEVDDSQNSKASTASKASSSVNFSNNKEVTDILDNVVYPKGFRKTQPVLKELRKLPNTKAAQEVLDVYDVKYLRNKEVRSPIAVIRTLVKNYLADDFTPIDQPGLADELIFTPITETVEKATCEFCKNNDGMVYFKNDKGTRPVKCDHNKDKLIEHAKRTQTLIEGTGYDFRMNKPTKPKKTPKLTLKEQVAAKRKLGGLIGGFNKPANLPK
ncbi:hypothetical protein QUF74_05645 [Candidatus Halobeggiatoa sp. HSG11]|nr:hypothetical protein [Candidatus Halobeggiatoa sp. HSG11]